MRFGLLPSLLAGAAWLAPAAASACEAAVCRVDPDALSLTQVITFDDQPSGFGPGREIAGLLVLPGASFAEHFAGQRVGEAAGFDRVEGPAAGPLTLRAGPRGQNLSLVRFTGNAVLTGWGTAGFPRREAQGEGAIAVLFDTDQSALAFDLRGGEGGSARVAFFRRDGAALAEVPVAPVGEFAVGFLRTGGAADIAGFVLTNADPEGIALDTLRFGRPPDLS